MKAALIAWLERRWYGEARAPWPLRALAAVHAWHAAARRRRFLAQAPVRPAAIPIVVIGNLAVGGAGKTPLTLALIQALRTRGWTPGVISRGHGGTARGPERVTPSSDPARVGDEPCLIAQRSGAPVAIARRRAEAARLLAASHEVDLLLADDGLQHYALARDLEILVIDGERRHGNGCLLPAGPLREAPERAASCDFVVLNGGQAQAGEVPMRLELMRALPLTGGAAVALQDFSGQRVHALAGIGNPARFFAALSRLGIEVLPHAFPDHHAFRAADLRFEPALPLLMTEKDAVKCRAFAPPSSYAVVADAILPESFFDAVDARLRALPGKSP